MNALCAVFNSHDWCPSTTGVNAFAQPDWLDQLNWCNPPFWMIGRLVRFLKVTGAEAVIIVPYWTRAPWWPLVCRDGVHFAPFVVEARELPVSDSLFSSGYHSANSLLCKVPGYRFFALKVSPRPSPAVLCTSPYDCPCGGLVPSVLRQMRWERE